MIKKKDIIDIDLKEDYQTFCKYQNNCDECVLLKKELIYANYEQPCEQIYDLITIIKWLLNHIIIDYGRNIRIIARI